MAMLWLFLVTNDDDYFVRAQWPLIFCINVSSVTFPWYEELITAAKQVVYMMMRLLKIIFIYFFRMLPPFLGNDMAVVAKEVRFFL